MGPMAQTGPTSPGITKSCRARAWSYDHGASSADAKPLFRVTVEFRDLGGQTELDMCMTLETAEAAAQTRAFIKTVGGNSTWDRLGEYLEKQVSQTEIFVINRTFDAPIDTMFDMWTTPEHFGAWLPPTGFTMEFRRIDIRPGGDAFLRHDQTGSSRCTAM
jgi:uncharacterized protein YndB with AHSA1/START domain